MQDELDLFVVACSCAHMVTMMWGAGRDLVNMAKKRPNVIPIIEDARHPQKYRMLVPMVDVIFAGAYFGHHSWNNLLIAVRLGTACPGSH